MIPASYLYKDLFHQTWYAPTDLPETPAPTPRRGIGIPIPGLWPLVRSIKARLGHPAGSPRPV